MHGISRKRSFTPDNRYINSLSFFILLANAINAQAVDTVYTAATAAPANLAR